MVVQIIDDIMRKLIFTLILLLAGYVGYMYFFGKGDDKANAEIVVRETKALGKAVGDFLKRQKDKYNEGEFDRLIDDVGKTLDRLKSDTNKESREVKDNLRELEKELKRIDADKLSDDQRERLDKLLEELKTNN